MVTALIPGELVITNQAPYLLWPKGDNDDEAFLLGVLSSMILDWYARRVVELHLNFHILNGFPIPDPGKGHPVRDRVVEIAARLAAVDDRFAEWAAEVGVAIGSANDETVKQDLICELDACVAYLYGLDDGDLAVIYETFSETVDYSDRHAAVLAHFRNLNDSVLRNRSSPSIAMTKQCLRLSLGSYPMRPPASWEVHPSTSSPPTSTSAATHY